MAVLQVRDLVLDCIRDEFVRISLFGSWGKGTARVTYDEELAIKLAEQILAYEQFMQLWYRWINTKWEKIHVINTN